MSASILQKALRYLRGPGNSVMVSVRSQRFFSSVSKWCRDRRNSIQVRDLATFERFLKACASRSGQILNQNAISNDIGIDNKTVNAWMGALESHYIIKRILPYHRNFNKRLVKSPKMVFLDTGLMCYLLEIKSVNQLIHHPLRGQIFETLIISEAIKARTNQIEDPHFYFFRDSVGNEVDLVYEEGGFPVPVEIKSAKTVSSDSFKGLVSFMKLAKVSKGHLIYGGLQKRRENNVAILPFKQALSAFTN